MINCLFAVVVACEHCCQVCADHMSLPRSPASLQAATTQPPQCPAVPTCEDNKESHHLFQEENQPMGECTFPRGQILSGGRTSSGEQSPPTCGNTSLLTVSQSVSMETVARADVEPSADVHVTPPSAGVHVTQVSADVHVTPPSAGVHVTQVSADVHVTPPSAGVHVTQVSADVHVIPPSAGVHVTQVSADVHVTPPSAGVHVTQPHHLPLSFAGHGSILQRDGLGVPCKGAMDSHVPVEDLNGFTHKVITRYDQSDMVLCVSCDLTCVSCDLTCVCACVM